MADTGGPAGLDPGEWARLVAAQRSLQSLVALPGAPASLEALRAGGFAQRGLDPRDAATLADQPLHRLHIYQKLVRGTLLEAARLMLSHTAAWLGDRFADDVRQFLEGELPRSAILRDVAYEFARWVEPRWRADDELPPFTADLARYELLVFDAGTAELDRRGDAALELSAERPVRLCPTTRLAYFDHAVHRVPGDDDDRTVPAREPAAVLAYRDTGNDHRQLELTPLAARIVERLLLGGRPLGLAVTEGCAAIGATVSQPVIDGLAALLADLGERGVLLGAAPETSLAERDAPSLSPWRGWLLGASTAAYTSFK